MAQTQSSPSATVSIKARELAHEICRIEDQRHLTFTEMAALIDAALAPLRRCVWQYLEDTIGEQRDPEEIAKALGQYAPASSRELAEALAPWEPEP